MSGGERTLATPIEPAKPYRKASFTCSGGFVKPWPPDITRVRSRRLRRASPFRQHDRAQDPGALRPQGAGRLRERRPGGEDVVHDHHRSAGQFDPSTVFEPRVRAGREHPGPVGQTLRPPQTHLRSDRVPVLEDGRRSGRPAGTRAADALPCQSRHPTAARPGPPAARNRNEQHVRPGAARGPQCPGEPLPQHTGQPPVTVLLVGEQDPTFPPRVPTRGPGRWAALPWNAGARSPGEQRSAVGAQGALGGRAARAAPWQEQIEECGEEGRQVAREPGRQGREPPP